MERISKGKNLIRLFFAVTTLNLIGVGTDNYALVLVSKPLIIVSLITYYSTVSLSRSRMYLAALFFSLLGDIFLLDKQEFFLPGLGSFLVTQVLYIVMVFKRSQTINWKTLLISVIPFALYLLLLMRTLAPGLEGMFYPVLVYGLVISVFGVAALQYHLNQRSAASSLLLTGALLFIGSDSMIAINKFHSPHMAYPVAIMLTYALAQYLICESVLLLESEEEIKRARGST